MVEIQSIIGLIGRALSDECYKGEASMDEGERLRLRALLFEAIAQGIALSFTFNTDILPQPVKIAPLMRRVTEILSPALPENIFMDIRIAIEEIAANIIEHSYGRTENAHISFFFSLTMRDITITMEDFGERGRYYDFESTGTRSPIMGSHRTPSGTKRGMGVYMARKIMDDIRYYSKPGEYNRIVMKKQLA